MPQYTKIHEAVEGPGPLLVGLVALGTAIATGGMGANLAVKAGFAKGMVAHAVIKAGFTGLCAQAAGAIVANKGDIFKAIDSLASVGTVKSLAISMVSAGLLHKVGGFLNIEQLNQTQQSCRLAELQYNLARASVSATLQMSVNGRLEGGIGGALMDAALGTILSPISSKVDGLHAVGKMSNFDRNIVHAFLGGVKGVIKNGDSDGLISGVAEAMVLVQCQDAFKEDSQQENKVGKIQ